MQELELWGLPKAKHSSLNWELVNLTNDKSTSTGVVDLRAISNWLGSYSLRAGGRSAARVFFFSILEIARTIRSLLAIPL